MFRTSHLQEMKRRYGKMYAPSEEGTDELVNQYKEDTPGQGIEEDEIEEGLGLQLKMAFDNDGWWGTDEPAIRRVLLAVPSKEDFSKVQTQYRRLYKGRNLIEDMTDELKTTEYNEMLAILQSKPEKARDVKGGRIYDPHGWATRLYNAMSIYYMGFIPGTDEEAIKAVFNEIQTKQEFEDTKDAYQSLYGTSLEADLDGDLDWSMDWRAIINQKDA